MTCIYIYINTNILTYIHTHIHTYIHTYVHTFIYTYIRTYVCTEWKLKEDKEKKQIKTNALLQISENISVCFWQTTFSHSSAYWTNTEPYNAGSIGGGLSTEEIKLSTYHTLPFTKLCLGMKVGQTTRWQLLRYTANSLFAAIADGHFRSTNLSRLVLCMLFKP